MLDEEVGNELGSYKSSEHILKEKKKPFLMMIATEERSTKVQI
jgi:hypothetical protein